MKITAKNTTARPKALPRASGGLQIVPPKSESTFIVKGEMGQDRIDRYAEVGLVIEPAQKRRGPAKKVESADPQPEASGAEVPMQSPE